MVVYNITLNIFRNSDIRQLLVCCILHNMDIYANLSLF